MLKCLHRSAKCLVCPFSAMILFLLLIRLAIRSRFLLQLQRPQQVMILHSTNITYEQLSHNRYDGCQFIFKCNFIVIVIAAELRHMTSKSKQVRFKGSNCRLFLGYIAIVHNLSGYRMCHHGSIQLTAFKGTVGLYFICVKQTDPRFWQGKRVLVAYDKPDEHYCPMECVSHRSINVPPL